MALTRGIFIRKDGKSVTDPAGTDPRSARKAMSGLVAGNADGVPRSGIFPQKDVLIVIGSQAGMVYRVKPFEGALIRDAAGSDGVVLYANDALTDVPTSPAPSTGSRWDLVYVQYPESTSDSTSSKPVLGVVQGTASGTPSKPSAALPANSYLLAESLVSAGNSTTVDASINQVWRYTVPRGVPIPVRNQAERDELNIFQGAQFVALDFPGSPVYTFDASVRKDWTSPALGLVARSFRSESMGGLSGDSRVPDAIDGVRLTKGRRYRIRFESNFQSSSGTSDSIFIFLCKAPAGTVGNTGGARLSDVRVHITAPQSIRTTTGAYSWNFTATADEIVRIYVEVARATGTSVFSVTSRELCVYDDGA
jgi:hypothetical protein